jgi:hypothetical protein
MEEVNDLGKSAFYTGKFLNVPTHHSAFEPFCVTQVEQ